MKSAPAADEPHVRADRRRAALLEGPILTTLLRLSGPNLINFIAISVLIVFDGVFVGRLGVEALTGVSMVFPFLVAAQHLAASGMGGAVASAIARAIGSGDRGRAEELVAHAVWLAVGLAGVTAGIMLAFGPSIYAAMGATGEVLREAIAYSTVLFAGIIAVYLLNILAAVIRGTGDMLFPALLLAAAVAGHLMLSPMLIFGLGAVGGLGTAGAGLGLVASFGLAALYAVGHLRGARSPLRLRLRGVRLRWALFMDFFRVGVPGIVNVAVNSMSVALLTGVMATLGLQAQLGYAIGARLEYIIIPLAFVIGTALVTMVGTNFGAQRHARARRIAWTGAAVAGGICGAVGVFFALWPKAWMGLFTADEAVIASGGHYLAIVAPAYGLFAFGQALYFSAQGFGHPMPAVLANVARLALSVGLAALAIASGAGATAVFASICAGFVLYAALNAWIMLRKRPVP